MADQDHLLRITDSTAALGNSISLKMVEFLDHVKDQPLGFRDLGLEFLSICKILNSLQTSLQQHFRSGQPFPRQAIPELTKILDQTLHDFTQLQYLLEKFLQYEQGGAFATLQKTWRLFFADKDISKVQSSLQTNKGALTMTMLLTNINPAPTSAPVGYEYGMLAAKLENPGLSTSVPPQQPTPLSPQPPSYTTFPPGSSPGGFQTYTTTSQPPRPPAGPPPGWQAPVQTTPKPPPGPPPASQPITRKPMPPPGPPPGFTVPESQAKVPRPPSGPPPGFVVPEVHKSPQPPTGPPPGFEVPSDSIARMPQPPPGPPPLVSVVPDIITPSLSEMSISDKTIGPAKTLRINVDPSRMPRRAPAQTVSTNVALQRTLASAAASGKHTIVEQLLTRGVSPNTGPEKLALREAVIHKEMASLKLLLEFGGDPDLKAADGSSPLRYACQYGREEEARLLLEYGADPNIMAPDRSPLNWSLDHRDKEANNSETTTGILLSYGADTNLIMGNGWTNLVWACSNWSQCGPAHINQLIQYSVDVNLKQTHEDFTPLYMACKENKLELVKLLLDNGADPNLPGPNPPVEACLRLPGCLQLLISAGADVHSNKTLMEKATHFNQIEVVKVLLDGGVNPNPTDEYYKPLNTSIRDSEFDITALLLSRGADPNAKGGEGFPIQMATTKPEGLKLLIGAGVDVMKSGVLETAVYRGSIASIPILLDAGYPIGGLPDDYYRPLSTAVRDNKPEYLDLLLSRGADPNLAGGEGMPLMLAANKPGILKQLLASGADITKTKGVLESAVYKNSIESIPILLEAGDPINGSPDDYYRPLHTAVRDNHPDIVALLLSKGADPNQKGGEGFPLQMAATKPEILKQLLAGGADPHTRGVIESAVYRKCMDSLPILVSAGADPNGHPDDYYRPAHTAVRDNLPEFLSKMLELGADPNLLGGEGLPLLNAACKQDPAYLKILLDAGADINIVRDGWTALMWACEKGVVENVRLLVQRGANAHIVDGKGRSAMEIAAEKGHDELVMLLLDAMG